MTVHNWLRKLFSQPSSAAHRSRRAPKRESRPRFSPRLEHLEDRTLPAILDISATGALTYTAGAGIDNDLGVSVSGTSYIFSDVEPIVITGAGSAGWAPSGGTSVLGPTASVTSIAIDLGNGTNTLRLNSVANAATVADSSGVGVNTLVGPNATTPWNVTATNAGNLTVSGNLVTFASYQNLTGGTANDTFTFTDTAGVTGAINGGAGTDALNYGLYTTAVVVNLGSNAPTLTSSLDSEQEVPPTTSIATGTATLVYNNVLRTFDISGAVTDFDPATVTGFHLHRAPFGVNGPIIVDLTGVPRIPSGTGFTFTASGLALPATDEAGFLGGITYLNIHNATFPGGAIRGQVFPAGAYVNAPGRATGTNGISNIENVTGGTGADSIVGNASVNTLSGGLGNDTLLGDRGNDTVSGDADNDIMVWSNGDGTDIMNGGTGTDLVQVNGAVGAGDAFVVGPGAGGRVAFQRTNLGTFALDIGTVETLTVNGIGGDDTMTVNDLTGVTNLTAVNFNGMAGNNTLFGPNATTTWNLTRANRGNFANAGITVNVVTTQNLSAGTGTDTLVGLNAASTWNITGSNAGNIVGTLSSFTGMENLTGGTADDTFTFTDAQGVTGAIDGGAGVDTLNYAAYTTGVVVNLGSNAPGLTASLDSEQEVPPNNSIATGTATLTYNNVTHAIDISGTINNFDPTTVTGFHIHRAPVGVNGPIIVDLMGLPRVPVGSGFTFAGTGLALPAADEANFLGGITYINVHRAPLFPGGEIRGQVFPAGVYVNAPGTATGTGGISNFENVSGGAGNDSVVGNASANTLLGAAGNDTLLGDRGNDTISGDANNDILVWSNGDGTDIMDGGTGIDLVQVNGSLAAGDVFVVSPGPGGRVDFDRTSPGPFSLDIGTVETLTVNGIDGDDSFEVNDLAGVADLTLVNFNGMAGSNTLIGPDVNTTWNLTRANRGNFANAGITVNFVTTQNLTGGTANDNFVFSDAVGVSGLIDGGAGIDTLNYSAYTTSVIVNLGSNAPGLTSSLDGGQEVPPRTTTASGSATLTYNNVARTIDITGSVTNFDPTQVVGFHIHRAPFGVNGPIIVDLMGLPRIPSGTGFTFAGTGLALPAVDEANFLGGITYLNIHSNTFPGGEIRGQIFPTAAYVAATATATGTGGISNIENATGGAATDSLVGSLADNTLAGSGGNDTIVASGGNDIIAGDANNDIMVWSNGDGTDVMDGGTGTDLVQVNGSLAANDVFVVGPGAGGRVDFDRTSPGPFSLDIGTVETLTVNGIVGDDSLEVNDLTGVTDLTAVNFNGGDGNNTLIGPNVATTWNLTSTNRGSFANAGITINYATNQNLTGGTAADSFVFSDTAGVTGTIDGGAGVDTLSYAAYTTAISVNLGSNAPGLTTSLDNQQEVPPTTSIATGTATLTYNNVARTIDISGSVTDFDPATVTGFHIHRAPFGVNGPIIVSLAGVPLVPSGTGFTFSATGLPLAATNEAAFLGGITYLNIHNATFPGGAIRGQIFPAGAYVNAPGTATGTGGVSNLENVTGGAGADSIVGNAAANTIAGSAGNDTLLGDRGNDTVSGDADNDIMVWSNGDGTDIMNGGTGTDLVQVNGSLAAGDVFVVGPGPGGRVDFDRTSPGPFSLDIGTVETLTVNGIVGDDSLTVNDLTGVTDLTAVNFNGGAGNNTLIGPNAATTWNLTSSNRGNFANAGITVNYTTNQNLTGGTSDDVFAFTDAVGGVTGAIDGGAGIDTLNYSAYTTAISVNLGSNAPGLTTSLDNQQEVPPTTSIATGTATLTYNNVARTIDISGSVTDFDPATVTGFHIHRAPFGVNGPIIVSLAGVPLVPSGTGFTFSATGLPLAATNEAAFLGGITYLNIHNATFPGGAIRGQIFPAGAYVNAPGTATGAGGVSNIDNVTGGAGADSIVGNASANGLAGGPGNDTLLGDRGNDTISGDADNDIMVWSNGDGTDIMNGGTGTDLVQVNGAVGAGDVFVVGPGAGGRVAFQRTNLGPFALNIGTVETLTVNGIGGDDSFTINNLTGVADLTAVNYNGGAGSNTLFGPNANTTWNITAANRGNFTNAAVTANFTTTQNLTGGTANDSFIFAAAGSLSGNVNGGTAGFDSLNNSAIPGATVTVTGPGTNHGFAGTATGVGGTFNNIDSVLTPNTVIIIGTPGNDTGTLVNNGGTLQFTRNGVTSNLPAGTTSFTFIGAGGNDLLTLDYSGGPLIASITFDASASADATLAVRGDGATTTAVYLADPAVNGNGTVTINGTQVITFVGLKPVDLSGFATATVTFPNADDVVGIANGLDFATGTIQALRISGTSGGVGFETVAAFNNTNLVINTMTVDGNDTVTVNSASNLNNNTNISVLTGAGIDAININGNITPPGNLVLQSGQNVTLNAGSANVFGNVTITAGSITEAGTGTITGNVLTTSSAAGTTLNNNNTVLTFKGTNTGGNLSFLNVSPPATPLTITGITATGGGSVVVTNSGEINTTGAISTTAGGDITLTDFTNRIVIGANVTAGFSGDITLNTFANNGILLDGSLITTIGTINVNAGGRILLRNNGASISTTSNVSLTAGDSISESGTGTITGALLTTSSVTGTALTNNNAVAGFMATNTASGNVSLTNTATLLSIFGITQAGGGNVTVTNTGEINTFGAITTTANGSISLTATGNRMIIGAAVSAGGLGIVNLTTTGAFNSIFLDGNVSSGSGAINLSAGGRIILRANGANITSGGNVTLTAGQSISEAAAGGAITTTSLLTATAADGITLTNANAVASFNATNTTSGNIVLTNTAAPLVITGISATGGNVTVTNTGGINTTGTIAGGIITLTATGTITIGAPVTAGGNVVLTTTGTIGDILVNALITSALGNVVAAAGRAITVNGSIVVGAAADVTLTAAGGPITETAGPTITARTLTTSSAGGTILANNNSVANFAATNTTGGNITLPNTAALLTILGISQTGGGNVTVSNTGAVINTGAITTAANGAISLTANGNSLTIAAGVTAGGSGAITLTTTGANGILLDANVTSTSGAITANAGGRILLRNNNASISTSGNVNLTAGDSISEAGTGTITGALLTASAVTGITLNNANVVTGFNATNTTSGNISLIDTATPLTVTGLSEVAGGIATLTNTGGGSITFSSPINGGYHLFVNTAGVTTFAATIGATTPLATVTTDAAGSAVISGGVITTTGAQTYNEPVTLGAGAVLTSTGGGNITFASTVNGAFSLTVNTAGATTFAGSVGGTTALASITTDAAGTTAINGGSATTTGAQTYNDAVTLGANTTVTSTAVGNITFGSTVNGAFSLTANSAGTTNFNGAVGGTTALTSLTTDAAGATDINGGLVTTTGAQTYNDPVVLTANAILTSTGGGNIAFASTVNGAFSLTVNTAGTTTFGGAVGGAAALTSLTTNAAGTTAINGGAVTTTGVQTYNDPVTLGANTTLTSTGAGNVTLASTVNGAFSLTVNTAGTTTFGGAVGGTTALTSVTTNAAGATAINGGAVTTTGAQSYNDAITLGANTTLTSTGGGGITLGSTVNGAFSLTLNTAGTTTFGGAVGGTTALTSVTTDAAGATAINGGAVTTTGAQTYNDPVTLGANAILTSTGAGSITFVGTVNGAFGLTVNTAGATTFGGAVGGTTALASVTTDAAGSTAINGGSVTTTGAQTYNDPVTLGANTTLTSTAAGNITLANTVNGAFSLTVNTSGVTAFGGAVGGATALTSVTTDAAGSTAITGGTVTTTAAQTYNDAVTLGANAILTSTAAGSITLAGTVNGAFSLTINTGGNTAFGGAVGGTTALTSITTNAAGTTDLNGGTATTTGAQTYNDPVVLTANTTLTSTGGGNITFGNTVNGAFSLTVNTAGITTFGGAVGGTTALTSVTTDAAGATAINGGSVTTTAAQAFNDAVSLGANTVLTTAGGNVTLGSTVNGAFNLTINAGGGTVTFGGAVGGTTALSNLTVNTAAAAGLALSQAFTITNLVTLNSTVAGVTQTAGSIAAAQLLLTGSGAFGLDQAANNFGTVAAQKTGATATSVTLRDANDLTVGTVGAVSGITTGTAGSNGGNVTINVGGTLTVAANGPIDTRAGAGGTLSVGSGVIINGAIFVGAGNITLNGGAANPDLIVCAPLTSAATITLTALRDVIICGTVTTTGPAADILVTADSDNNGVGGVWIQNKSATEMGQLFSSRHISVTGASLFNPPNAGNSIFVDANATLTPITAVANITLTGKSPPASAPMRLNGNVSSTGGNITITSTGNLTTLGLATASAGSISVTAAGSATFNGSVAATGSGTILLTATGAASNITTNASVAAGTGNITATAGANIALTTGNWSTFGNITLTAGAAGGAGLIVEGGAAISTPVLTTSSRGGTLLTNANNIVGSFTATNAAGGAIQLVNIRPLTVAGITQLASGDVLITNTGEIFVDGSVLANDGKVVLNSIPNALTVNALVRNLTGNVTLCGSAINLNAPVTAGDTIRLNSGSTVTQTGAAILSATNLGVIANGTVTLTLDNLIAGTLSIVNSGAGSTIDFVNNASTTLTVGTIPAASCYPITTNGVTSSNDITLSNKLGSLVIAQPISTGGSPATVRLRAGGAISSPAVTGTIRTGNLGVQAPGDITLFQANEVSIFSAASTTGAIAFNNAGGLNIGATAAQGGFNPATFGVVTGGPSFTLTTAGNLRILDNLSVASGNITLNVAAAQSASVTIDNATITALTTNLFMGSPSPSSTEQLLTVFNPAGGLFLPSGAFNYFAQGGGVHSLALSGGGSAGQVENYIVGPGTNQGSLVFSGAVSRVLAFSGVNQAIVDNITAGTQIVTGTDGSDLVEVGDATVLPGLDYLAVAVDAPAFPSLLMARKTNLLINTQQGSQTGGDLVNVNFSRPSTGLTRLEINGSSAGDTVNLASVAGALTAVTVNGLGGGDVINVTGVATASAGVTINAGDGDDLIAIANPGAYSGLTANGNAGNDVFNVSNTPIDTVLNGGAGTNTYNIGGGNLDNIRGPLTINGSPVQTVSQSTQCLEFTVAVIATGDTININDSAKAQPTEYTILQSANDPASPTLVARDTTDAAGTPLSLNLTYTQIARLNLMSGTANDTVNVQPSTSTFYDLDADGNTGFPGNTLLVNLINPDGSPITDAQLLTSATPNAGAFIFTGTPPSHQTICFRNFQFIPAANQFVVSSTPDPQSTTIDQTRAGFDIAVVNPLRQANVQFQVNLPAAFFLTPQFAPPTPAPGTILAPRIASGDVTGDGFSDVVVALGPGNQPFVTVFDGREISLNGRAVAIAQFLAYDPQFSGGVNIAIGQVGGGGDFRAEIVTAPASGGGPNVKTFQFVPNPGGDLTQQIQPVSGPLANFFAFDPRFTGGVNLAVGDINADGFGDIVAAPGFGGGPVVNIFSGASQGAQPALIDSFFAYDPNFTGGVRVAAGDFYRDTKATETPFADIVTAPGFGAGPHVKVFDGRDRALRDQFFAFPTPLGANAVTPFPSNGAPVQGVGGVAFVDLNSDGQLDIAVGAAAGDFARVRVFDGGALRFRQQLRIVVSTPFVADYFADFLVSGTASGQADIFNPPFDTLIDPSNGNPVFGRFAPENDPRHLQGGVFVAGSVLAI